MAKEDLIQYAADRFSAEAEYSWDDENFIFRHHGNRKWFAVAMRMPYQWLGVYSYRIVSSIPSSRTTVSKRSPFCLPVSAAGSEA